MTAPSNDAPQELSPEARAIMARARKSFMLSMGLLLVGFIAIGVALVYRATRAEAPPTVFAADSLQLPQGAQVVSAIAASGMVTVTYTIGPATQVRIFDSTGALQRQFDIVIE